MDTKIDIDELERLAKAATSLPWKMVDASAFLEDEDFEIRNGGHCIGYGTNEKDAAYIVAACNELPKLIKEIRDLEVYSAYLETVNSDLIAEMNGYMAKVADLEKQVRELERQNSFFLKSLKENYICPYSYCKYDVGSELDEGECAATDSRECWIQAAKEAGK